MSAVEDWLAGDTAPEEIFNELVDVLGQALVFAERRAGHSGLTVGYAGGTFDGNTVADGTVAGLTDDATNYIVVNRSTRAVTSSTGTTNWNDTTTYGRMARAVFASGVLTWRDERLSPGGIFLSSASGGSTQGKHAIYVAALSMSPRVTSGCASIAVIGGAANQPDFRTLDFDSAAQEYAEFSLVMPKKWNEGTVTFVPHWSHASTTTNFGVAWSLQAVAVGNDDALAATYGTAQTSVDTGGTTDDLYAGHESSAITVAGTPGAEEMVFFRVSRVVSDGGDNLAIDARLHGITLYVTTNADTDA
jgi:hypothetical protein